MSFGKFHMFSGLPGCTSSQLIGIVHIFQGQTLKNVTLYFSPTISSELRNPFQGTSSKLSRTDTEVTVTNRDT